MADYDEASGLPTDKSYFECNLPPFLEKSIEKMKIAWEKYDKGEFSSWDCDYCELQSNLNIAELGQAITTEQAWYLREKYLRIQRNEHIE